MYLSTLEMVGVMIALLLSLLTVIYSLWQNKILLDQNRVLFTANKILRERLKNSVERPF
jgi:hypothetical protein